MKSERLIWIAVAIAVIWYLLKNKLTPNQQRLAGTLPKTAPVAVTPNPQLQLAQPTLGSQLTNAAFTSGIGLAGATLNSWLNSGTDSAAGSSYVDDTGTDFVSPEGSDYNDFASFDVGSLTLN